MSQRRISPESGDAAFALVEATTAQVTRFLAAHIAERAANGLGGIAFLTGPTRAGKSLVGIRLAKALRRRRLPVAIALPAVVREDIVPGRIVSAQGRRSIAHRFGDSGAIQKIFERAGVVIIDEVQFTPEPLWESVEAAVRDHAARGGWSVLLGMLYASDRTTFPLSARLRAHATVAIALTAVCAVCGRPNAIYSQRLLHGKPAPATLPFLLGPSDAITYEPRCTACHILDGG
ncbi:MAG: hypothetical protein KDD77_07655 [Caldilineaceae bacterium]|nr:hypothetical protein [Caldilineaceae bacterium]